MEARLYRWDKEKGRPGELVAVAPCKELPGGRGLLQFEVKDLAILPGAWYLVVEDAAKIVRCPCPCHRGDDCYDRNCKCVCHYDSSGFLTKKPNKGGSK